MTTLLPKDSDNNPIPALRLLENGAHKIDVSNVSVRNSTAFNSKTHIISLYATSPVYLRTGDTNVTASTTDHYFPSGVYYDISIGDDKVGQHTHIAVLRVDQDCSLYISEKHSECLQD